MSIVPPEKKLTEEQLERLANNAGIDVFALKAFCEVEGGGIGFSDVTGKIIIRFEESHFKKEFPDWKAHQGVWQHEIQNQTTAWAAFTSAYNLNHEDAMRSTSVGIMQVMCFNHKICGFDSVEEMWAFNEVSEANQVETAIRFIKADTVLYKALKARNWSIVAEHYNGKGFRQLAERTGSVPYDRRMAFAYVKFANEQATHRTTTTVNLRAGYGTNYPVKEVLRVNTALLITGQFQDWKQVKVIATATEGWVAAKYIS